MIDGWWKVGGLWCWDLFGSVVWIWPMIMGAHWLCVSMCKSEWVAVTRWVIVCAHIVSTWFAHFNGFWSFDTLFFVFFFAVADHLLVGSVRFGGSAEAVVAICCSECSWAILCLTQFSSIHFSTVFLCRAAVVVFCVGLFLMVTCYGYCCCCYYFVFVIEGDWLTVRQTDKLTACLHRVNLMYCNIYD